MKLKPGKTQRTRANAAKKNTKALTAGQVALLRRSFAVVADQADIAALVFYRNLFTLDPSLRPLFHTSIELQGRKLMEALQFTLATLEQPKKLLPVLEAMGRRHVSYGVKDKHYATVVAAMLLTLREILRGKFTAPVETAWKLALGLVGETMLRGAHQIQELKRQKPPATFGNRRGKR
jgi:hemoglobin-like flavoprotein